MAGKRDDDFSMKLDDFSRLAIRLAERLKAPDTVNTLNAIVGMIQRVADKFTPLVVFAARLDQTNKLNEKIVQTGWLPHPILPLETFRLDTPTAELEDQISHYVSGNFDAIEVFFQESATRYGIDETLSVVMAEALECHRRQCYRASVRVLFPEIERVVRKVLEVPIDRGIASIPDARERIGTLPFSMVFDHPGTLSIYDKLNEHMYRKVKSSLELSAAQADPVPNRHAAIHGLVDYSSMQNSMNTIIMADFIFRLLGAIQGQKDVQPIKT